MDTPKQESVISTRTPLPNEAGFSMNMYLIHDHMGRVQFTFRGATSDEWGFVLEDVGRFAAYMKEKGWRFDGEKSPAQDIPETIPATVNNKTGELVYENVDRDGNKQPEVKTATAGRLSVETKDEKIYWKVVDAVFAQGEKGTKYGISVYPEVLQSAKLDVRPGQPVPDIHGWRVDYVCNEKGYPWKVTRLLPPK